MILVVDADGQQHEFDCPARFYTDEHNNLCIEDGDERLIKVFAARQWCQVGGDDDGAS